tara:strand:+ start:11263 stop:12270 length:1008 start_codon:yes stop_codon:yes gene_type:complete
MLVGYGQEEMHFSQFTDAQTLFNPATVGVFHGSLRFNGHYRTQWGKAGQPYETMAASLDLPILSDVTGNDFFAIGGYYIQDKAGLSETSTMNSGLNLNFGKSFDPDETHFWSMGAKVTYNQKKMNNNSNLHWGSQWDVIDGTGWTGTPGMVEGEVSKTYVGFGAGFNHFFTNHDNIKTMFGISMNNINRPVVNYLNDEYKLRASVFVHGEVEVHNHESHVAVIPRFAALFQGSQRYFIVGSSLDFLIKEAGKMTGVVKEATLEIGAFYRWKDAMVFEAQFNWAGIGIGVSYDLPVSKVGKAVNYVGATEVLLHYKLGYKTGLKSKHDSHRFDSIH